MSGEGQPTDIDKIDGDDESEDPVKLLYIWNSSERLEESIRFTLDYEWK